MTDATQLANDLFESACRDYFKAVAETGKYALLSTALRVREAYPTATHVIVEASDQGPWLSLYRIVVPERAPDSADEGYDEVYGDAQDYVTWLHDEDPHQVWMPFVVDSPTRYSSTLDLDLILFCEGDAEKAVALTKEA